MWCQRNSAVYLLKHNISIILGEIEYMRDNIAVVKIMFAELNYDYMEEIVMYNGWDFIGKSYLISKSVISKLKLKANEFDHIFVKVRLLVRID